MESIPFEVPQSLKTYAEQYDTDPKKAIEKLGKQLNRRGPDALGHFLMAWFHYLQGNHDEAVRYAHKARIFAPGSPFLEYVHYYLSHPESFKAWLPEDIGHENLKNNSHQVNLDLIHDLENLISRLSDAEHKKITLTPDGEVDNADLSDSTSEVDDIASETLANIYKKQGKKKEAIEVYKKLCERHPNKEKKYKKEIEKLEKEE